MHDCHLAQIPPAIALALPRLTLQAMIGPLAFSIAMALLWLVVAPSADGGRQTRRQTMHGKRRRVPTVVGNYADAVVTLEEDMLPRRLVALVEVDRGVEFSGPLTNWPPEVWTDYHRHHADMGAYTLQVRNVWALHRPVVLEGVLNQKGFVTRAPRAMRDVFRPALPLQILQHEGYHGEARCSLQEVLVACDFEPLTFQTPKAIRLPKPTADAIIAGSLQWIFCLASWTAGEPLLLRWPDQAWLQAALRRGYGLTEKGPTPLTSVCLFRCKS